MNEESMEAIKRRLAKKKGKNKPDMKNLAGSQNVWNSSHWAGTPGAKNAIKNYMNKGNKGGKGGIRNIQPMGPLTPLKGNKPGLAARGTKWYK